MLFTDPLFLFYFLPVSLLALRTCGTGKGFTPIARWTIILSTLVFYAYENWLWCILFLTVVGGIYVCTIPVLIAQTRLARRAGLVVAVIFALFSLGLFKYLNWLVTLFPGLQPVQNALASYFGSEGLIILPPGISFYVFEALSFTIDAYRGRIERKIRWLDYLSFLAMFPRFVAGPIVRYSDMAAQFTAWTAPRYSQGLSVFALGFTIKNLFADQFAIFVPYAFGSHQPDMAQAWLGSLSYAFQLYFDFWSYSLMASGLGLCLGFEFPDNFKSPYRATSVSDFWQRWHITLSQWLRDYLYISLGGNRCAPWRVYLNLLLTMTIAGLWHGASFTFVMWGAYHGILLVGERLVGEARLSRLPLRSRQLITFLLVLLGWVVFRSESFTQVASVLRGMVGLHGIAPQFSLLLVEKHLPSLLLILAACYFWVRIEPRIVAQSPISTCIFPKHVQYTLLGSFAAALILCLSSQEIPFLYFQF